MKRPFALAVLPSLVLLSLVACTTEYVTERTVVPAEPAPTDASDAAPEASSSSHDAAPPDAGNGECNALVNDAPTVHVEGSTSAAPTMTGGTISDGTYVLTHFTVFADPGAPPPAGLGQDVTQKLVFQGKTVQEVATAGGLDQGPESWTFTTSGSTLVTKQTCPGKSTSSVSYTATASTILRRWAQNGYEIVQTLEKK